MRIPTRLRGFPENDTRAGTGRMPRRQRGQKLHRPEGRGGMVGSQTQDGEHSMGRGSVLKQKTDRQVPGTRQKGRQCRSKIGAMVEPENIFQNPL